MTPRRMQKPEVSSLRDAVLEIDSLIEPGTAAQPVELSGEAWDRLVSLATAEINDRKLSMQSSVDVLEFDRELEALREFRRRVLVALGEQPNNPDSIDPIVAIESLREFRDSPLGNLASSVRQGPPVKGEEFSQVAAFERAGEVAGAWPAPDPGAEFSPVPPPLKKKRKAKAPAQVDLEQAIEAKGVAQ